MAVWLDLIGSFVFGSLLGLNVLRMNADMMDHSFKASLSYIAQSSAVTIGQIVEEDLRKVGYGVSGTAISLADSAELEFLADLDGDSEADTLHYYLGTAEEASATLNPEDRVLYRALNNGTPQKIDLGVTEFRLSYFDADGDSLALPVTVGDIRHIRLDMVVESAVPYDTTYARAFLRLRVAPKNLGS